MSVLTQTPPKTGPVFTFDPNSHTYYLDGVEIPSVTMCLKTAGLTRNYDGFHEAQLRGLHVHTACEWLDLNDLDWNSVYPQWLGYVKAYARFKDDTGVTPELIEYQTYHPAFRFAGTLDRTGRLEDGMAIIDLKTGGHEDWHRFQTAGYKIMGQSKFADYKRYSVYLSEDGTYSVDPHTDEADLRVFLAALTITHTKWAIR